MRIQLIHPPADKGYNTNEAQWLRSVPIGLELIASALPKDLEIEIIDGENLPLERILPEVSGDFVGVSDWYSKHQNALAILNQAKSRGAKTIIGGPNATHLAQRILTNHPFVDYAVVGDGEEATRGVISGEHLDEIPNLVYRTGEDIKINYIQDDSLETLFNLEHLTKIQHPEKNPLPVSSIRGCIKAELSDRCSFCSMQHRLRVMDPRLVWQQISLLHEKYGFDYFFETGDSFMVGNYPEKLLSARPKDLRDIKFRIYANPEQITEDSTRIIRKLNVREVFLGVESGSEEILSSAGKTHTRTQANKALQLIHERGMQIQIPFIYGLPGESKKTMEDTYRWAKQITSKYTSIKLLVSTPIPLIGSALFEHLRKDSAVRKEYSGDLDQDDSLDYNQLIELQTKYRTSTTLPEIMEYLQKTKMLVGETNAPGLGIVRNCSDATS